MMLAKGSISTRLKSLLKDLKITLRATHSQGWAGKWSRAGPSLVMPRAFNKDVNPVEAFCGLRPKQ